MNYRLNKYNENYIMINQFEAFLVQTTLMDKENLSKEDIKAYDEIIKLINFMLYYKNGKGRHITIEEIAIHKDSTLASYIIELEEKNRKEITFSEIINALLACIEKNEWEYYEELTQIIKDLKEQDCLKHDYISFKIIKGSEITNYIINNSHRIPIAYNNSNDKNVYLYENDQIISTEIPKQKESSSKTKVRTI